MPPSFFGELSLMYDVPRATTIMVRQAAEMVAPQHRAPDVPRGALQASTAGVCWTLDRIAFRLLVMRQSTAKFRRAMTEAVPPDQYAPPPVSGPALTTAARRAGRWTFWTRT